MLPEVLTTKVGRTTLRRATEADLEAMVGLLAEDSMAPDPETTPDADRESYVAAFRTIDADPAHLLVVAESPGGEVVGIMQLTELPGLSNRGRSRLQVEGVRVRSDGRGSGLGGAMIGWAVDEARRRGAGLVQLTSNRARTEAHRLYEGLGFDPSHTGFKLHLS